MFNNFNNFKPNNLIPNLDNLIENFKITKTNDKKEITTTTDESGPNKKLKTKNYNEQNIIPAKYSDSDDSEDEGMEDYKVGGYHAVHVG